MVSEKDTKKCSATSKRSERDPPRVKMELRAKEKNPVMMIVVILASFS